MREACRVSGLLLVLFMALPWCAAMAQGPPPPPPPPTCSPGGASSASSCSSWGGFVRTLPGTVCTLNVGNNNVSADYTNKIRNCNEAQQRLQGIAGLQCDAINIIELNTAEQCGCACDPNNTCTPQFSPDGSYLGCFDDPQRPARCKEGGFGYYEPDRCELCKGCGAGEPASCEAQARILCDPDHYEEPYCHEVPDKGCDCMCVRKGPCVPPPAQCVEQVITGPADCDSGNYAICRKCDYDSDGTYDWGSCVAHPTHCMSGLSTLETLVRLGNCNSPLEDLLGDQRHFLRQCLERCSTPIVEGAAAFIADAKVRTISGDFNCDPDGCCWFGTCPWVERLSNYGLEICNRNAGTTILGCGVDLVLSNSCGCAVQENRDPSPGDHYTIAFNTASRAWTGGILEILSAESATSCSDPDLHSSTSDHLGGSVSCPTSENGQPVGSCSSWGHLTGKVRYYSRADECDRPELGIPQVLVCETATAQGSAHCTTNASSGSSAFVTIGQAQTSQAATCVNGTPYNPQPKVVTKGEFVTPSLVRREDGNLYYMVERDLQRDQGSECSAAIAQSPCEAEADPLNPGVDFLMMEQAACANIALPVDEGLDQ